MTQYGAWENGGDGDTAQPVAQRWVIEGSHDELEDHLLTKVDVERGHVIEAVARKLAWSGRSRGSTVTVTVPATPAVAAELDAFMEKLVQVMIAAPEDGASTATRSWVILRPLQIKLGRAVKAGGSAAIDRDMTIEGARALRAELRGFIGESKSPLRPLLTALDRELKGRRRRR